MAESGVKRTKRSYKTNDGTMIPGFVRGAPNHGSLGPETPLDNSNMFEEVGADGHKDFSGKIGGMESLVSENLDDPGFDASGKDFYKHGTPYGEKAMFNQLPPGMDISDQKFMIINEMPLRTYMGGVTFPGDTPWPVRDVEE
jgi:hypothetical protein